jgi:SSS family solute:Na+ symporter
MFGGFILLVSFAWYKIGSPLEVFTTLPKEHLSITGGKSISYILVWFFIALWTFIDPGFYQRCAAAKSPRTAQKGIMISVIFWFIFDALTLTSGLYARAAIDTNQGLFAFPALGEYLLPPIFYGLFIVGILATIMSTIDSLGFISAFTFGKDIIGKTRIKQYSSVQLTKLGLIVMAVIAILLAYALPSVVSLWYLTGSILVPGLLIPFILTFTKLNLSNKQGLVLLIVPMFISLAWYIISIFSTQSILFKLEPFYPGMITSILILITILFNTNLKTRD